jgi:hypothetical protein
MMAGGHKEKYKKAKKINKTYIVNADAALFVDNRYGSIYVTTWNENKTAIDVVITVSGNKESNVDKRLNSIEIDLEATKSTVQARTKIGSFSGNNTSMEINYTIKIPKNGSIDLNNIYGRIALGKIYGKAMLRCQYGNLDIDELNNTNNSVNIQYCDDSKIWLMKAGKIKAQYSDIKMAKAENLEVKSQYSDVKIGEITALSYDSQYGDVLIGKCERITGRSGYSDLSVENVLESLNVNIQYGDLKMALVESTKSITVNATYSDILLLYPRDSKFSFEYLLEYGDVSGNTDNFKYTTKSEKNFKSHYIGQYGGGSNTRIYINTSYGDIRWAKM